MWDIGEVDARFNGSQFLPNGSGLLSRNPLDRFSRAMLSVRKGHKVEQAKDFLGRLLGFKCRVYLKPRSLDASLE